MQVIIEFAFIVLMAIITVTALYWPFISTCNGYCCNTARTTENKVDTPDAIPYQVHESSQPLSRYSRSVGGRPGIAVLNTFYRGLASITIEHQPIYTIAKLAAQVRPESNDKQPTFINKNKFPVITVSGAHGTEQEIYDTVIMAQALAKAQGVVIVNEVKPNSAAWRAWQRLVLDGVVHWQEEDLLAHENQVWVKGQYKNLNTNTAVSEYLYDIMRRFVKIDEADETVYYVISQTRENEIRESYQRDTSFTVTNLTTAFHAAVLKVLFPKIQIVMELEDEEPSENTSLTKAVEFLNTYIVS